ncbi:MAG TPA: hypothetical protein VGG13_03835 [Candidatus Saccharimonadales bacterium]|jgi:guanylate kinase
MNQLKHMAEFRSVLADYKPSLVARKLLEKTKLVLLLAPSGGGRNTIIDKLIETGNYHYVVSDTTRDKRVNNGVLEQNGREYWFRSEAEILNDLKQGKFLEAQIIHNQQVSGISMRELEKAGSLHKIAINEVDTLGISNVAPTKPDTIGVIILPPSFQEWLRRIEARGAMDVTERQRRFETAAEIFEMAKDGTYPIIINDKLDVVVNKLDQLARLGELEQDQQQVRQLAANLYRETKAYLSGRA